MRIASQLTGLPVAIQIRALLAYYLPDQMETVLKLARKFEPFRDSTGNGIRVDSRNDLTNSRILSDIYQGQEVKRLPADIYKYAAAMLQGFRAWTGYGSSSSGGIRSEHSISNLALTVEELARACAESISAEHSQKAEAAVSSTTINGFRISPRGKGTTIRVLSGGGKVADEMAELRKEVEKLGLSRVRFTLPGSDRVVSAEEFVHMVLKQIRSPEIGRKLRRNNEHPSFSEKLTGNLTYIPGGDEYKKLDNYIDKLPGADNPYSEHIELNTGEILRVKDRTLRKILHQLAALAQFQGTKRHSR